ncbi:MmcB family DNA repair protein [Bacillus sp. V3B]|uniref:MmcB family DNA repair protein n=1 Tax=Bacillus sp. V3B TaxID=2804915 RepID=UPI00210DBE03|nr:MmcB family DNA repair protein [Bacillus sp. V3B]MCQ6276232.1 MmcB family DNA repair protein [Bacillus sp. V3B]
MKATITGVDPLSKRILLDLNRGVKVSDIPTHYPVSIDQSKRLSRFNNMLKLAKENLEEEHYNRFQLLGIKGLPLAPLFRQSDWGGLLEILSVVTDETKRDEIQFLMNALDEKRKRIHEFKEKTDLTLSQLEHTEKSLIKKEKELIKLQQKMNDQIKIFHQYPEPFRSFLNEYLGLYEERLVLAKRLHVKWQQSLSSDGILHYDEVTRIHYIDDFHRFMESLKSRHNRGLEYRWNPGTDIDRLRKETPWEEVPHNGKYLIPSVFSDPFIDSINKINQELQDTRGKKEEIQKELYKMKHKTIQSYLELTEVSDYLSSVDLKRHKELQEKALKWLFQRDYIAIADFPLPNGQTANIFAYNESQIVIVKIKVSQEDLMTDQKWIEYLPYCHDFYFLTPSDLQSLVTEEIQNVNCGQFVEVENNIKLIKPDERQINKVDQANALKFSATQLLSRKFIYGY